MILDWPKQYKEKLTDARSALSRIRRGARIFIASACGEPQLLVKTLLDMAPSFSDVEIIHFLDLGLTDYTSEMYTEHFRHNALFIGANARAAIKSGHADYTPVFLSEVSQLMQRGAMPIDVALVTVSPPDMNGYVSLVRRIVDLAGQHSQSRLLALGGGGYNMEVVPTAWTSVLHIMRGEPVPEYLPPYWVELFMNTTGHEPLFYPDIEMKVGPNTEERIDKELSMTLEGLKKNIREIHGLF